MDRKTFPPSGMDPADIRADFLRYFCRTLGRHSFHTAPQYQFTALALSVRERLIERSNNTRHTYQLNNDRQLCYLSLEYLIGRSLRNALANLGLTDAVSTALDQLGLSLEEIAELEHDAGLGNGGLGRLAACFLDSCAALQLPVLGYGIHYKYGMFYQQIENGYQVEEPDNWMQDGHPWEVERREFAQRIQFGGSVERYVDEAGVQRARWLSTEDVLAIPYDVPIPGYRNGTVNTLRLWSSAATAEFDLAEFHTGSYPEAVAAKNAAENITMVLYPNDASENGKELRLRQQYFLASASLKDTLRRHGADLSSYAAKHCFQLNDTHPSIAVAELMRLLLDEHRFDWDQAWAITTCTMAYTNHTLLPEALEQWPVRLLERLLPRLMEIIYDINEQFLELVDKRWPGDLERRRRMSLIGEGEEPMVRMAYLAIVGSFSVNGVAKLHSRLLTEGLFKDFYELWPEKFNNKTNGVTHRRWLLECNPELSGLITQTIGDGWVTEIDQLQRLVPHAVDSEFRSRWWVAKQTSKQRLTAFVQEKCGVHFDPAAMFDVQVKRIHEYKRQLLNVLHVIHLYNRIKRGDVAKWTPRCILLGGKAAPGYAMAKLVIKLINEVARVVNADPDSRGLLSVAFLPNYGVSAMEVLCPGTDLSEQISTAGKEASGTG
ncbi:MAG: glycogen/starch/alpha-glucan family phosphorylase, partial [Gammaproteobacteria bacterium]|nr:glycogen/starch/alpha-glucan family phosphorylase [Gammaproteobacteria bacterium]